MKITVLTSSYPRFDGDGTAPFIKSLAEGYIRLGNEVDVVAPYDLQVKPMPTNGVNIHRFRYIFSPSLHIMGHARSLESDVKLKPLTFFLLPLFLISAVFTLLKVTHQQKTQVIHVNWVLPNGPIALVVSKIRNIPYVLSLHGSDVYVAKKNRLFRWVAKQVFRNASSVTACSPELRDAAISMGAPQDTLLLAWGANPEIFTPKLRSQRVRKRYGVSEDGVLVVALGRMVYKKGFDVLISAWKDIVAKYPDAQLVIGGDGPIRDLLDAQAKNLGIERNVILPGKIAWDKVPEFLASADIFVLPSVVDIHGNMDGLPTVLLEAMSSGNAVIASEIAGVSLVIKNEINGMLVEQKDQKQLSDTLQLMISDPSKRERLSREARQAVVDEYNWNMVAQKIIGLFQNAIKAG